MGWKLILFFSFVSSVAFGQVNPPVKFNNGGMVLGGTMLGIFPGVVQADSLSASGSSVVSAIAGSTAPSGGPYIASTAGSGTNTTLTGSTVMGGVCVLTDTNGLSTTYAPTANTDTARGNALISALAASGSGKTVTFGPGNYYFTQTQNTASFFPVGGYYYGRGARLYVNASTTVQTAGAQAPNTAFYISGTCTLRDIVFDGGNVGGLTGLWLDTNSGVDLSHLQWKNWGAVALVLNDSVGGAVKIPGGILESSQFYHNGTAIWVVTGAEYWRITDCIIDSNTNGILSYAGNTNFISCEVTQNTGIGVDIEAGINDGHISFLGGSINHNGVKSVYLAPGVAESVTFEGTHCYSNSGSSGWIDVSGTTSGINWIGGNVDAPIENSNGVVNAVSSFTGVAFDTPPVGGNHFAKASFDAFSAPQLAKIISTGCVTGTNVWPYNTPITTDSTLVTTSSTTSVSSTQRLSGGSIDGIIIGGTTPANASFKNVIATSGTYTLPGQGQGPLQLQYSSDRSAITRANAYIHLGGPGDSNSNASFMTAYGYASADGATVYAPGFYGFHPTNYAGNTAGRFEWWLRSVTTDSAPSLLAYIDAGGMSVTGTLAVSGSGTFGGDVTTAGNLKTSGGILIGAFGNGTLVSGTALVVASTVSSTSIIGITDTSTGALTNVGNLTVTKGSGSFTVRSTSGVLDTSTFDWWQIK